MDDELKLDDVAMKALVPMLVAVQDAQKAVHEVACRLMGVSKNEYNLIVDDRGMYLKQVEVSTPDPVLDQPGSDS